MNSALLFDLDGTLVETDHLHLLAFQTVFEPFGVTLDRERYNKDMIGSCNADIGRIFLPQLNVAEQARVLEEKEVVYRSYVRDLAPVAGLLPLLDFCDAQNLGRAVVTNAPRENADLLVVSLGLHARLPIVVSAYQLPRGKPDPLPYLTALERTGAQAENSVAFEDSATGVRSAAAAGVAVVGLTTSLSPERLKEAGACLIVTDFTDPRIYELITQRRVA